MRNFSNFEKNYIKHLVERSRNLQANIPIVILKDLFYSEKIVFDAHNPNGALSFFRKDEVLNPKEIFDVYERILELALLMRYLKDNGCIIDFTLSEKKGIYPYSDVQDVDVIKGYTKEGLSRYYIKCDAIVRDFLLESLNCYVFVGQVLKDLVENNFASVEERTLNEAQKQSFYARLTFLASIIVPSAVIIIENLL